MVLPCNTQGVDAGYKGGEGEVSYYALYRGLNRPHSTGGGGGWSRCGPVTTSFRRRTSWSPERGSSSRGDRQTGDHKEEENVRFFVELALSEGFTGNGISFGKLFLDSRMADVSSGLYHIRHTSMVVVVDLPVRAVYHAQLLL